MVIWKHLFQRILQHQNRKRKYSWEAADRLPCPYIPPQTSALVTPSGIPDQLSFGLTQLGCFHILQSILFILLFLNCSAVLLRAIVKHSYVPLQAWTWSQKGFCLFVWSCKIYPRIYLIIHTHTVVKKNKPSKKKNSSRLRKLMTQSKDKAHGCYICTWTMFFATNPSYGSINTVPDSQ